ncbi:MAG: hypothetical protein ACC682_14715 [Gemmatimonadota bacterium]
MMKKLLATPAPLLLVPALALASVRTVAAQEAEPEPPAIAAVAGVAPGVLALVDLSTFEVMRIVEGLNNIHGAAISPDGTLAFALSLSQADQAISVIDVASGAVVRVMEFAAPAHHAAMDPSGRHVYLTWGYGGTGSDGPRGIARVDPESGAVDNIRSEGTPYYVAVSPDGSFLYATTLYPHRLLKIALPAFEVVARETVDEPPNHIAVSEDGTALFVTLSSGGVAKADAGTLEVLGTVDTGADAHAVALAGDPVRLFVANRRAQTLTVLDPETLERIDEIETPPVPTHLLRLPGGALLISAAGSQELVKLDPNSLEVIDRLPLPAQPHQTAATAGR